MFIARSIAQYIAVFQLAVVLFAFLIVVLILRMPISCLCINVFLYSFFCKWIWYYSV